MTSRERVGPRKRAVNFFPLPHTVELGDGRSEGKIGSEVRRNPNGREINGDLDHRPRLIPCRKRQMKICTAKRRAAGGRGGEGNGRERER